VGGEEEEEESSSDEAIGYLMVEFRADLFKTGGNSAMKLSRMLTIAGAIKRLATTDILQVEECCYRINKRHKADANNQNEIKSRGMKGVADIQVGEAGNLLIGRNTPKHRISATLRPDSACVTLLN
jgi:hypothetical protein